MSKALLKATTIAALLLVAGLAFVLTRGREQSGTRREASASPAPAGSTPPQSGDPGPELRPGETRPGTKPGTIVVQPFQPGLPKTISTDYRVPSHRDDARIAKRDDGAVIFEQAIAMARQLHSAETTPEDDVQILDAIMGFYRLIYRRNPVAGENSEVMRALTGENEHRIIVFPPDHPDLNGAGELDDRWGTPYFFHALSGTQLDIWSAGPDRQRNSRDDVKLGLEADISAP